MEEIDNVICWTNLIPVDSIVCLVSSHSLQMQSIFHMSVLFVLVEGKSLSIEVFLSGIQSERPSLHCSKIEFQCGVNYKLDKC